MIFFGKKLKRTKTVNEVKPKAVEDNNAENTIEENIPYKIDLG